MDNTIKEIKKRIGQNLLISRFFIIIPFILMWGFNFFDNEDGLILIGTIITPMSFHFRSVFKYLVESMILDDSEEKISLQNNKKKLLILLNVFFILEVLSIIILLVADGVFGKLDIHGVAIGLGIVETVFGHITNTVVNTLFKEDNSEKGN